MRLSELNAAPYNPRKIGEKALDGLKYSLEEFGDVSGIVYNTRTGRLVAGHQRVKALQAKFGDLLIENGTVKAGDEEFKVRFVDWPEAKEKAANVAANSPTISGEFTPDLSGLLDDIKLDMPEAFEAMDFGSLDLDFDEPTTLPAEDEAPEVSKNEPLVKKGDIFRLGKHRLMCGDSTSSDDFDLLFNGERAHICVTSPPYNAGELEVKGQTGTGKKYNQFDDKQTESEYRDFLTANINNALLKCDEVFYNIGLVAGNKRVLIDLMGAYRDSFKDLIYWVKATAAPHIQPGIVNNKVEWIICIGNNGSRQFKYPQFSQGTYWNVIEGAGASANEFSAIHKATYPVYLPSNLIANFCPPSGAVLDCFGGTGTTMVAAHQLGRKSFLMELDPAYCEVIIRRFAETCSDSNGNIDFEHVNGSLTLEEIVANANS